MATKTISLEATLRDRVGKGAARATRRSGRVPAVIYGDKKDPVSISLDPKALRTELSHAGFFSHLIEITLDGAKHRTLARDIQLHPVTDEPLHADFVRVGAGTRTHVQVPVTFENQAASPGLKRGGVLNIVRHELDLICSAENIPEHIVVDLTGLEIGDSVHISAIKLPEGVTSAISERDFTIASIASPTVRAEDSPAAES
jgi:large subunit ribosomal protein L25